MSRAKSDPSELLVAFQETGDPTDVIEQMVGNGVSDRDIKSNLASFVHPSVDLDAAIARAREQSNGANGSGHNAPVREHIRLIASSDFASLPELEPLIEGIADRNCTTMTFGGISVGKSLVAIHKAVHIAMGWDWCGRKVRQGAVLYIAAEGGKGVRQRLLAFYQHYGIDAEDVPLYLIEDPVDFYNSDADLKFILAKIDELPLEEPIEYIAIDTVSQVLAGANENSPDGMGRFVRNKNLLRQRTGAHIDCLHHAGKDEERGARGHSSLKADVDTEIKVTQPSEGLVSIKTTKQRDHRAGERWDFKIIEVKIVRRMDGKTAIVPVLEEIETAPRQAETPKPQRLPHTQKIALRALEDAINEAGQKAAPSNHIADGALVVSVDLWRRYAYARGISASDEPSAKRKAFARAAQALLASGRVCCWDDHYWIPTRVAQQ